ncbi:MAG: hypothetical protein AB3N14_05750 [Flavobacteriaceae bacterium]
MEEKKNDKAFKTPEGYFDGFKDRLLDKLAEGDSSLPDNDGFAVPEGYFDNLKEQTTAKAYEKPESKVVQLHAYKKYYWAAASVAAIFLLVLGLQIFQGEDITFDSLANTEIEDYLDATDLGLSSYEIAETVNLDELDVQNIFEDQINEENIMDYLDENIDDFDELNLDTDE